MRAVSVAVLAAGIVTLSAPGARAATPTLAGATCGMAMTNDVVGLVANPGTLIGPLYGAISDARAADRGLPTVTVTCGVVGGAGTYFDLVAARTSATGSGAAVAGDVVFFTATPNGAVYVCTTVTVTDASGATSTEYFDAPSGALTTQIDGAHCALGIWQVLPPSVVCDVDAALCPLDPQWNLVVVPTVVAE